MVTIYLGTQGVGGGGGGSLNRVVYAKINGMKSYIDNSTTLILTLHSDINVNYYGFSFYVCVFNICIAIVTFNFIFNPGNKE